jgi:hypothetical protein
MERLRKEKKPDVQKKPIGRVGKLLVEGLAAVAAAGIIASCSATVQVRASASTASSASSQPSSGFGMPTLHESEIRLSREGDTLRAEVVEIGGINCDAFNRCSTRFEKLPRARVHFEAFDREARRFYEIEGCSGDAAQPSAETAEPADGGQPADAGTVASRPSEDGGSPPAASQPSREGQSCDISKVPRGSRIRVRFVPSQDYDRPVRGDTATTVRE